MKNEYKLISLGVSINVYQNEKDFISHCIKELYRRTNSTGECLRDLRLYCNHELTLEYTRVNMADYTTIVYEIFESIKVSEKIAEDKANKDNNRGTYLKVMENLVNPKGLRTLVINEESIYYDEKLEVFVRRSNDFSVRVSKHVLDYKGLETYGDCYCMLLDLGIDHEIILDIFIVNGAEKIDSLHEIRLFAKRTQESLKMKKSDYCSPDDVAFLTELREHPNNLAVAVEIERFNEVKDRLEKLSKVTYKVTNNSAEYMHKDINYNEADNSVEIALEPHRGIHKMNAFN